MAAAERFMRRSAIVLGGGVVGACTALHLAMRGIEVTLVDHRSPANETSYGNAGLIQREAVQPYAFPLAPLALAAISLRLGTAVRYHPGAIPGLAAPLLRYWWNSRAGNYEPVAAAYARLIRHATDEHATLIEMSGSHDLVARLGWRAIFANGRRLEREAAAARRLAPLHGIEMSVSDGDALAREEPSLRRRLAGSIHWRNSWSVRDPAALVGRYLDQLRLLGGRILIGDANTLRQQAGGWSVRTAEGTVSTDLAVVALGPWSDGLVRRFGYRFPLFVKRGYHRHFRCAAPPSMPLLDQARGVMLAPMNIGLRITTGAEFARLGTNPTPVQMRGAERYAGRLLTLGPPVDEPIWMGSRPCSADMLPVIGPATRHVGLWFNFAHGHQGLTLGPVTGRMLAQMVCGEPAIVEPEPYLPRRFER